ncbi:hypothetical protein BDZ97DRAFT_1797055 [Flammula alnicola]|nr:hypothetical protein BDZ97DRAFT_1797055 [Flammula alnicola]
MTEVQIVTTETNTIEDVVPNDISANSQPEASVRLVEPIPFDSTNAEKREVDPAELVGKVFVNVYHISPKPYDEDTSLPGSFGIAFTDGSRYHVRIHAAWESADVDVDVDVDDLAGKHVTAASLLRCEGHFFRDYDFMRSSGMKKYTALGIKVEGSDEWVRFFGTEEAYNSDGDGLTVCENLDVFLVKMNGAPAKKTRSRKR